MSLLEFIRQLNRRVPRCEAFPSGMVTEASGPPVSASSSFCVFYVDSDTGKIYVDPERSGTWEEIISATALSASGDVLTANT